MGPGWCITRRQAGARFWGFELPSWWKLWGWRWERKRGLPVLFSDVYFGWALRKQIRKDSSRRWPSEGAFTSWIVSSVWGCAVVQDCWVSVNGSSESRDGLGLPHTGEAGPWHGDQTRGPLRKRVKGGKQWCGWDLGPGQQGLLGGRPWRLGPWRCACTGQSRDGRISHLLLAVFSLLSPLSSPTNSKTRCCYLAPVSSPFTSRSQCFLLVSLWLQEQTWGQSDPRGSPTE